MPTNVSTCNKYANAYSHTYAYVTLIGTGDVGEFDAYMHLGTKLHACTRTQAMLTNNGSSAAHMRFGGSSDVTTSTVADVYFDSDGFVKLDNGCVRACMCFYIPNENEGALS